MIPTLTTVAIADPPGDIQRREIPSPAVPHRHDSRIRIPS